MKHLLATVLALFCLIPAVNALPQDATVYIIHGIDGDDLNLDPLLPVDVAVNGGCTLAGFTYEEITDPLALPAGTYNIKIGLADPVNPCSQPALIDVDVDLVAGENATIIAHLDDQFNLTASKFTNDLSETATLEGRVALHHTAAAPAVDITLKRVDFIYDPKFVVAGATNGARAQLDILYGLWRVRFAPAGVNNTVFGPVNLIVPPNANLQIYAVGSKVNGTENLIVLPL